MFCRNCGKELKGNSSFCSNCGFPVDKNSIDTIQVNSSGTDKKSSDKELTLTSSDTKSVVESPEKEKWGITDIVGLIIFIIFGIVDLWLTRKLIKFWVYPYLGIPDTNFKEVIGYLLSSNGDKNGAVIKFLPYCGLCLTWVSSVLFSVYAFGSVVYYAIKGEPENVKSVSIALIISVASSLVLSVCLIKEKVFWTVLVILVIAAAIADKMGLLGDKDKKENKEK